MQMKTMALAALAAWMATCPAAAQDSEAADRLETLENLQEVLRDGNLALQVIVAYQGELQDYAKQDAVGALGARLSASVCRSIAAAQIICDRLVATYDHGVPNDAALGP